MYTIGYEKSQYIINIFHVLHRKILKALYLNLCCLLNIKMGSIMTSAHLEAKVFTLFTNVILELHKLVCNTLQYFPFHEENMYTSKLYGTTSSTMNAKMQIKQLQNVCTPVQTAPSLPSLQLNF